MNLTHDIETLIDLALREDVGRGDATSEALIPASTTATANLALREGGRVAGAKLAASVFRRVDSSLTIEILHEDGSDVEPGTSVLRVSGPARSVLSGERTALNFFARLTGIATKTRDANKHIEGTKTRLLDTRKTTPGWRMLEKYAVRMGGGTNHRFALDDLILIKDNHIAVVGSVTEAVLLAKKNRTLAQKIEVEVDTLEQLDEAIAALPDMILLDNMDLAALSEAVRRVDGRIPLEASGNMTPERLRDVALTGVDFISMGALTHGARSLDVGLDITSLVAVR